MPGNIHIVTGEAPGVQKIRQPFEYPRKQMRDSILIR